MTQYHVSLDGQGYVLDLDRYGKRIREPFVPKQAEGSVAVGDLRGPEQVLVISDWSGGEGYAVHDQDRPGRFRLGSGIDGYTLPGTLRLGPYASVVGTTAVNQLRALQAYGSKLYAFGTAGQVYSWDGTTFANPHTLASAGFQVCAAVYLGKLYGGNITNGNLLTFDGTTWTDAAAVAAGPIWSLMTHYRQAAQYLYLGVSGAGTGGISRIFYYDTSAISAGQFDPEEALPVVMFVLGERLYIIAADAGSSSWSLYSVDDATSGGVWRRHATLPGRGFPSSVAVVGKTAYVGDTLLGRVYSWDGSDLRVELELGSAATPYTGSLFLANWRGAAWVGIQSDGALGFLRYDGETRFRPVTGLASAGADFRSAAVWQDRLYGGTGEAGAAKLIRIDPTLYGGSGSTTSGLIDFGLPGVSKLLRSVTLVTAPMPSGQSVQVEYQLDDAGAWTSLGTFSTTNGTSVTYSFTSDVTCRQVSFRLQLVGVAGSSSSPVVYELAVRYVPRPAVTREWELAVILEGTAELPLVTLDGAPEPLTGAQLTAGLWTTAGKVGPVTLVDLDGVSYAVFVVDVREEIAKVTQRHGYQRLGVVRLVEAA